MISKFNLLIISAILTLTSHAMAFDFLYNEMTAGKIAAAADDYRSTEEQHQNDPRRLLGLKIANKDIAEISKIVESIVNLDMGSASARTAIQLENVALNLMREIKNDTSISTNALIQKQKAIHAILLEIKDLNNNVIRN